MVKALLGKVLTTHSPLATSEVPARVKQGGVSMEEDKCLKLEYDADEDFKSIFLSKEGLKSQPLSARVEDGIEEYYDSVRFENEDLEGFAIFHKDFVEPEYVVTYEQRCRSQ